MIVLESGGSEQIEKIQRGREHLEPRGTEDEFLGPIPILPLEVLLAGQILRILSFILLGESNSRFLYQNMVAKSGHSTPVSDP